MYALYKNICYIAGVFQRALLNAQLDGNCRAGRPYVSELVTTALPHPYAMLWFLAAIFFQVKCVFDHVALCQYV